MVIPAQHDIFHLRNPLALVKWLVSFFGRKVCLLFWTEKIKFGRKEMKRQSPKHIVFHKNSWQFYMLSMSVDQYLQRALDQEMRLASYSYNK